MFPHKRTCVQSVRKGAIGRKLPVCVHVCVLHRGFWTLVLFICYYICMGISPTLESVIVTCLKKLLGDYVATRHLEYVFL